MRSIPFVILLCAVCVRTSPAQDNVHGEYRGDLAPQIDRDVETALPDLLAFYTEIHTHPELSLGETKSAARIAARLKSLGYAVTTDIGGHGLVGVLKNGPGPTVLIRGDMDALPVTEETGLPYASKVTAPGAGGAPVGVMHACGHDVHQTTLVGSAAVLASLREEWSGTVIALAQPAEEIGKGARMMIEDGLFEKVPKPNACIALHVSASEPVGIVTYTSGWALANVDSVDITIFGRGGHGSRPNETIDPVMAAAQVIVSLQTIVSRRVDPREPAVITVGSIHAGSKHNIISNEAKLQITVRSYSDETRRVLLDGIRDVTVHTCRAMGCKRDPQIVVRDNEFTPATYNDPQLTATAVGVIGAVIGKDNVQARRPVMGGEDFGRYSKFLKVPGFMFMLGSVPHERYEASRREGGEPLPSLHSSKYYPDPEPTIRTGVRCLSSLALSLLDAKP